MMPAQRSASATAVDRPGWRSLQWWSAQELDTLARTIHATWALWCGEWAVCEVSGKVICHIASPSQGKVHTNWVGLGERADARAWVEAVEPGWVAQALFAKPLPGSEAVPTGPLGCQVGAQAWADAQARLRALLALGDGAPEAGPDSSIWRAWSGAVGVALPLGPAVVHLLLNAACVRGLVSTPPKSASAPGRPLTSLGEAIADQKLTLTVQFDDIEMDIGSLAGIQVGDVVPLRHELAHALSVNVGQVAICSAYLGRRKGRKAVELTPSAPAI